MMATRQPRPGNPRPAASFLAKKRIPWVTDTTHGEEATQR